MCTWLASDVYTRRSCTLHWQVSGHASRVNVAARRQSGDGGRGTVSNRAGRASVRRQCTAVSLLSLSGDIRPASLLSRPCEQVDRPDGKLLGAVSRLIDLDDDAPARRNHADDAAAPACSKVAKLWLALGSRRSGHSAAYLCMHNREGSLSLVRTRGGSPKAILHASEGRATALLPFAAAPVECLAARAGEAVQSDGDAGQQARRFLGIGLTIWRRHLVLGLRRRTS